MQEPVAPRATIDRVAEQAGVSISTVSKVLNGRPDVARDTRDRVERLLEAANYRRRGTAGAVTAGLVELVVHEFTDAWSMEVVDGAREAAEQRGMSLVLTKSGDRHAPGDEWLDGVLRRRPAAVLLVFSALPPAMRRRLRSRSIRFAVLDPAGDPPPDAPSVGATNWAGGLAAARHLIDLGHREIGVITGPTDMMCSLARLDGVRSAMASAGLPLPPERIAHGDFLVEGGEIAARRMLAEARPTAIFAGSDLQAIGVLQAASDAGLRVPEDLSVVGFDDVSIASVMRPRLTTVRQPLRQMAAEAVRMALDADTLPAGGMHVDLATRLVVRDTTAAPRA